MRHNKIAQGAGADRISTGMRLSFGKIVGSAARVKPNQKLMTLRTTEDMLDVAKDALRKSYHKIPTPCKIVVEPN